MLYIAYTYMHIYIYIYIHMLKGSLSARARRKLTTRNVALTPREKNTKLIPMCFPLGNIVRYTDINELLYCNNSFISAYLTYTIATFHRRRPT